MDNIDLFDAGVFRISTAEATSMDPQQRLLLEYALLAFSDAGCTTDMLHGSNVGVFVGIATADAREVHAASGKNRGVYSANGTSHSTAVGRISFTFGLEGPSVAYDTACSSSLVALDAATQCLQLHNCDLALVAGVNVMLTPSISKAFGVAGMTSPTGQCHSFDAAADGFCRGEGCGAVVLQRLGEAGADERTVHAVVRSVHVKQDGQSASLMAPNGTSQSKLLRATLAGASLEGHDVDYIEAMSVGSPLGDLIEFGAITAVMGDGRLNEGSLVMGALKTNIGHTETASGMAGLIKAVLVLQLEKATCIAGLCTLNPKIEVIAKDLPVVFPRATEPLRLHSGKPPGQALVAGVSAFGYAGTIAHAILAQAPFEQARPVVGTEKSVAFLVR